MGTVLHSADGTGWREVAQVDASLEALAHGDGTYVAVGEGTDGGVATSSSDGTTWSDPVPLPFDPLDVAYGNDTWVVIGGTEVATSEDGATWSTSPLDMDESYLFAESLAFGDDRFVLSVVQCGGSRCYSMGTRSSDDGVAWSPIDEGSAFGGAQIAGFAWRDGFGAVGYSWEELDLDARNMCEQETYPVAGPWSGQGAFPAEPTAPTELGFTGLAATAEHWVATATVGAPACVYGESPEVPYAVVISSDLVSWDVISESDVALNDIVVVGGTPAGEPPAAEDEPPTSTAPACSVDLNAPVLDSYEAAEQQVDGGYGPGREAVARDVEALSAATGVEWCAEMVIAIAASTCNDWGQDSETPVPPEGRAAWAEQVAPALGISVEAAATAIEAGWETLPPCG
jgi:hypothetical protein